MRGIFLLLAVVLMLGLTTAEAYLPPAGPVFDRTAYAFSLSADRCFREIRYDGTDSLLNAIFRDRQQHDDPMIGYSAALSLRKQPSLHWIFEAGLQYSVRGYQYRSADKTFGPSIDTNYVTVTNVTQAIDEILIRHRYAYLEIPLRLHYQFTENRLRYHVAAGVAFGMPLNHSLSTRYKFSNGEREVKKSDPAGESLRLSIQPVLSAGIEFYYTHRLRFLLEPTYRFALTALNDGVIQERLRSTGITFGMIYRYR